MNFSTCSAFTLNLAASSLILSQMALGMMSWHPNFVANSTSFFRASSISSVALVIPFAAASWMILSTSSALTFNLKAIALSSLQIFAERTSSHLLTSMLTISSNARCGKK